MVHCLEMSISSPEVWTEGSAAVLLNADLCEKVLKQAGFPPIEEFWFVSVSVV